MIEECERKFKLFMAHKARCANQNKAIEEIELRPSEEATEEVKLRPREDATEEVEIRANESTLTLEEGAGFKTEY